MRAHIREGGEYSYVPAKGPSPWTRLRGAIVSLFSHTLRSCSTVAIAFIAMIEPSQRGIHCVAKARTVHRCKKGFSGVKVKKSWALCRRGRERLVPRIG